MNVEDERRLVQIIEEEHLRNNHRGIDEVSKELKLKYYAPKLMDKVTKFVNNCDVCNTEKYVRNPPKPLYKTTETPQKPGEIVHIDVFYTIEKLLFLTIIDKFSKHACVIKLLVWLQSLKDPDSKTLRWRIKLNEYNFNISYVKGKENQVADFLSRINTDQNEINYQNKIPSDIATIHSGKEELNDYIHIREGIVNTCKHQIILVKEKQKELKTVHKNRHIYIDEIDLNSENLTTEILKRNLPEKGKIGIYSELPYSIYNKLQILIVKLFSNNLKLHFIKYSKRAIDLLDQEQTLKIIKTEHEENKHLGVNKTYDNLKGKYYFPKLEKLINEYIDNCETCGKTKYDRKPYKIKFEISETPNDVNEIVIMDIYMTKNKNYFTTFDKFSKYLHIKYTLDKNPITLIKLIQEYITTFGKPKKVIFDNAFDVISITQFLNRINADNHEINMLGDDGYYEVISDNATIHSGEEDQNDLIPIKEEPELKIEEKVLEATEYYNNTIHGTTQYKPVEIQQGLTNKEKLYKKLKSKKCKWINYQNRKREKQPEIEQKEIYIKNYANERHKEQPKFRKVDIIKVQLSIVSLYSKNSNLKFIKCTNRAIDLLTEEQCFEKISEIHEKSNHRGILENYEEENKFYYQGIIKLITKYMNNCETCNLAKYDRKLVKPEFQLSETPKNINEIEKELWIKTQSGGLTLEKEMQ
ncbi:unnamed protein product [Hermetia illucens]|uniref:RNA-directed DNA polymerase n=1 Tax=Hermetia illucens TaxID=343691 RepID=A0A7R8YQM6_HERIL|nr:unnamed protein product [Hermetia illucens]